MKLKIFVFTVLVSLCISCKEKIIEPVELKFSTGVFILNEGNFMVSNAEISYYSPENDTLINDLYLTQNSGSSLGDILQSAAIINNDLFLVLNNSKKIEIVDALTLKHKATITNLSYPRYILKVTDNKAYLTNGKNPGNVYVIDTQNYRIEDTVKVGNQPENLTFCNEKVFVANGAWGNDSTVSVISIRDNSVDSTINIGHGTTDIISDTENFIWVLCQGKVEYDNNWQVVDETQSKIVKVNSENYNIIEEYNIGQLNDGFSPKNIAFDKQTKRVYFIEKEGIYFIDIINKQISDLFISGTFYGLEVNKTGNIYTFSDEGFVTSGKMSVYSSEGECMFCNQNVGIGPNSCVFID